MGLTLIELVIALVIIGISSATVASLLVTSLNFAQNNKSYASDLRDAEICYETILAVHEESLWEKKTSRIAYDSCPTNVGASDLEAWVRSPYYSDLFMSSGEQIICNNSELTCTSLQFNSEDSTKFSISIRGKNHLELVVPSPPQ